MLFCGSRLRNLINRRAGLDELRDRAAKDGMRTMRQDGIEKIVSGYSDYSQLMQVVGVGLG
jgi:type II secretory ATPase GspE/PulE/Tfp pilus assembly ATPase PilB-like protein